MYTRLNPYLGFKDEARPAMEFYRTVFGGTLTMTTFGQSQPGAGEGIMHAMLEGEHGIVFMASDTPPGMEHHAGASISMSLSGDDEALLRGWWQKLSDGATVTMPLDKAPWGDTFGMLTDRFGICWLVNISPAKAA